MNLNKPGTQAAFAGLIGVRQPAVNVMVSKGLLAPGAPLREWLLAYCAHIREQAAGRQADMDVGLTAERSRLAREQADRLSMQNAQTRKLLAPVSVIEEVIARAGSHVAGILDGVPGAIRRRDPTVSEATLRVVAEEIARARNVAAGTKLDDILEEEEQTEDDEVQDV